jgi:CubicO group peptidase (beta-lactamase class C family)
MAKTGLYWGHPHAAATEDCPVRRRVVVGEVHDLHAAVLGGKAPHAGLFGSVSALTNVAHWSVNAYHGRSNDIDAETIRNFWAYRGVGSQCLGWDTPSPQGSSASSLWPKNGVGHLGFTGTSLWIAPDQELIVGFASNRVHPIVEGGALPGVPASPRFKAFQQFRPQLHQAILETLEYT